MLTEAGETIAEFRGHSRFIWRARTGETPVAEEIPADRASR